jgi:lactoylglutathione lyase
MKSIVVELFVSDVEASIGFYQALGFGVVKRWGDWLIMQRDGVKLTLQGDSHAVAGPHYFTPNIGRHPRGTGVEIVVQVDDVDGLHAEAQSKDLNVVKPIQDRDWGARDFRVADPDGYFVRFTSPLRGE